MKNESTGTGRNTALFGMRRETKRHAALIAMVCARKALSPLRSATAVHVFTSLLYCAFALIPFATNAATNDLTSALQRGLFEEEANRNLDAAAQAYQTVSAQFDKDRKLAATAIFRLGEVYRKQNKTNEAVAQYERIVREFADQDTLATLSRQNLAGLVTKRAAANTSEQLPSVSDASDAELLKRIKNLSRGELLQTLPTLVPDQLLNRLLEQLNTTEAKSTELRQQVGENHPSIKQMEASREVLNKQVDERIGGIIKAIEIRAATVESAGAAARIKNNSDSTVTTVTDDEESEIRRIQAMIQNSPDLINAQSGDPSMTPLGRAASKGQLRVAEFLLAHGADMNLNLPLSQAASGGHKAMVELLLKHGAPVNAASGSGVTALHRAAERGFLSVAEVLINAKADPNLRDDTDRTALTLAAESSFVPVATVLLAHGANPNIVCQTRKNWGNDRSNCGAPIHFAVTRAGDAMLALLLTNRADVTLRNPFGETALDIAASLGQTGKARQLIAAGADVNASAGPANSGAATPLYRAVSDGRREVAALLLEQGANPNTTVYSGQAGVTPLMVAATKVDSEIVSLLLKHKADANLFDAKGITALLNAINVRSAKSVRALLAAGASPDTKTESGSPVLIKAVADSRDAEIVSALIEAKVNVNATNSNSSDGRTALHYAVMVNRKDLVELLLAAGADANLRDQTGRTPLDYLKPNPTPFGAPHLGFGGVPVQVGTPPSVESKPTDIATLLRQHGALDELPDFKRIRITRQGISSPLEALSKGAKLTNQFTLLETVMHFYNQSSAYSESSRGFIPPRLALPFPDFGRIIIHRPGQKSGSKEQEIKVDLLNGRSDVDCANDVPVQFGDVIEIPESIHALNEPTPDPLMRISLVGIPIPARAARIVPGANASVLDEAIEKEQADARADKQRVACLNKTVQLVVAGKTTPLTVDSWKEGFLNQALATMEARAVLRSSSDLSRLKITRKNSKTGKPVILTVDNTDTNDALWLQDGDVIDVPDKP